MILRRNILQVAIALACVAVVLAWVSFLASALVRRQIPRWTYAGTSYDYSWDTGPGYTDYYTDSAVAGLAKRESEAAQQILKILFPELQMKNFDVLFLLKAHENPCRMDELIACRGLPSATVKPFIEAALAHKQTAETLRLAGGSVFAQNANAFISTFALVVSFLSLAITFLTYRRNYAKGAG